MMRKEKSNSDLILNIQSSMQKIKNNQDSTKPPKMLSSTVMDYHKSEFDWNLRQGIQMNNCKEIVKKCSTKSKGTQIPG